MTLRAALPNPRALLWLLLALVLAWSAAPAFAQQQDAPRDYFGRRAPDQTPPATAQPPSTQPGTPQLDKSASTFKMPAFLQRTVAQIAEWQRELTTRLSQEVRAYKESGAWAPAFALILISFLYGVFHAAGPGHGKMVTTTYFLANRAAATQGVVMGVLIALVQACSAIAIVSVLSLILSIGASRIVGSLTVVELISYALIAGFGLYMLYGFISGKACDHHHHGPADGPGHDHGHDHDHHAHHDHHGHDHKHDHAHHDHRHDHAHADRHAPRHPNNLILSSGERSEARIEGWEDSKNRAAHHASGPSFDTRAQSRATRDEAVEVRREIERRERLSAMIWRMLPVAFIAGLRPCTGAILVLLFALANGVFFLGVVSTFAMAVGVAITVSLMGLGVIFVRRSVAAVAKPGARTAAIAHRTVGILGGLLILAIAVLLFLGTWQRSGFSL